MASGPQKNVEIVVARDGTVNIEANNFKGVGCKDATRELEMVLTGGNNANKDQKPKPDFYATITGSNTLRN